jgi:hypothetical protein
MRNGAIRVEVESYGLLKVLQKLQVLITSNHKYRRQYIISLCSDSTRVSLKCEAGDLTITPHDQCVGNCQYCFVT